MRKRNKKFSIYQCIDRQMKPLELGFTDLDAAEARAEELTRQHQQPHIVVDSENDVQISRFEVEEVTITETPKRTAGMSLADAIAASRKVEQEENKKRRDHDNRRKRVVNAMRAVTRDRQLCAIHKENLQAEVCDDTFRHCQFRKARKALENNFFVDKTNTPCDDTSSQKVPTTTEPTT